IKAGVPVTFHQDCPVLPPNMLFSMWCACTRKTKLGVQLNENEKISPLEALKAVTINAAYQYFEEKEKGSIKQGKNADFVILDTNPLKCGVDKLKDIKVLETIKAGVTVYKG
ncbi:MAG: amidohydrolase family protein, partial [Oscillospiraceae bacterium]